MITKSKISISLDKEVEKWLEQNKVNPSKLINSLLKEYFGKEVFEV